MSMTTGNSTAILSPADVDALLVQPVLAESVAAQVAKVISTTGESLRLPVVTQDPQAAWVPEAAEIPISDQGLDEVQVRYHALKGLTVLSNELLADSSPGAAQLVGEGLARDIARKLDEAFFGATVANGPSGIAAASGVQAVEVDGAFSNLDPFHEAISKAETVGRDWRVRHHPCCRTRSRQDQDGSWQQCAAPGERSDGPDQSNGRRRPPPRLSLG